MFGNVVPAPVATATIRGAARSSIHQRKEGAHLSGLARIAAIPRPMQYSRSARFSRPVVLPRTQINASPTLQVRVAEVVHFTGIGFRLPYSAGPLMSGSPLPVSL